MLCLQVKIEALNDSRQIGLCLYNVVVLSAVGLTFTLILEGSVVLIYGIISGCVIIGTTLTQAIVFVPKVCKYTCWHRRLSRICVRLVITKTRLFKYTENFFTKTIDNFQMKNSNIFHISVQNIDCGYSLEPPRRGEAVLTSTHNPCFEQKYEK